MRDDLEIPYPSQGSVQGDDYSPRDYRGSGRMDPNTRRMAIIAGSIGGALVVLMGVWSVTGHRSTGVPVIEADSRPVREKPANSGGMTVSGADETIMSGDSDGKAVVAPAPESPAIAALKAVPAQVAATTAAVPAAAPAISSEPVATMPAAASAAVVPAAPAGTRVAGLAEVPVPGLLNANRAVPVPALPVARPRVAPIQSPPPASLVQSSPQSRPVATAGAGRMQVQLAAVGSEQAAKGEWARLTHKFPSLLSSRQPAVSRTEHDGKTFWRLRVSGFQDMASASAFCGELRSKGGTCALASF